MKILSSSKTGLELIKKKRRRKSTRRAQNSPSVSLLEEGYQFIKEKCQQYKINDQDYESLSKLLKRPPQGVEWALFSALWSEHCSYKSSKKHLKKLFSSGGSLGKKRKTESISSSVLKSFGENAGVIDLGQGEKVAFKIESHNHPSFIEPFQGAATGVGGILRDIFTMGARPIALANFLCFGQLKAPRMKQLVKEVVRGIGSYGNCVGVPTLTGQTEFHSSYDNNILVNALALGFFSPGDEIITSSASGEGNDVVYVGAKTGRDGLHGASMSSESFVSAKDLKPTVQIGDPFLENLLIEACLEVIKKKGVVAMQDMGAAGLASSSFEMASKGGVGLSLHLDKVPLRDSTLTPEEILLSESQERMLLICRPKNFRIIKACFKKWNLDAIKIGKVVKEKKISLFWKKRRICHINPDILVKKAPAYSLPYSIHKRTKSRQKENWQSDKISFFSSKEARDLLLDILKSPLGCSRDFIFRQYDQRVGGKTERDSAENFAVLRLPHSQRSLALILGGRPHVMRDDPSEGGIDAVIYPHLELAIKGFKALALTNCLNFGDPKNQNVMGEFVASVEALAEMSQVLDLPVVSGNVSFYNETKSKNTRITSTPVTGLIGLRDKYDLLPSSYFQEEGEEIFLVQMPQRENEILWRDLGLKRKKILHGFEEQHSEKGNSFFKKRGALDSHLLSSFSTWLCELSLSFPISASRLVSRWGLLYTLARMGLGEKKLFRTSSLKSKDSLGKDLGCKIRISKSTPLFKEIFYQAIFVLNRAHSSSFERALLRCPLKEVSWEKIGVVEGESFNFSPLFSIPIQDIRYAYFSTFKKFF